MQIKSLRSSGWALLIAIAVPASAGTWSAPVVLATDAYNGGIALDGAGNMTSVWYQNVQPNGALVEIWASTAAFRQPWSPPSNLSGPTSAAAQTPQLRVSAAGNATAIFGNTSQVASFVDHPSGGTWGAAAPTNGINEYFASNDSGDQSLAWGGGGPRGTANSIVVVVRPHGGQWGAATTLATGTYVALNGSVVAPDGGTAVSWESYTSVCGSRVCNTSNWTLHVSTRAAGAQSWVDSGPLLGPSATRHYGPLAADANGNLGVMSASSGNIVSLVRHGGVWSAPAVVASLAAVAFGPANPAYVNLPGQALDNRIYASDSSGHATLVSETPGLTNLVAVDGNLASNTWGPVTNISGQSQPNYFWFKMSSSGSAVAFWSEPMSTSGTTTWRAVTRAGAGLAWGASAIVGTSFEPGIPTPDSVAVNAAGEAAVVFHGSLSNFTTNVLYSSTYHP